MNKILITGSSSGIGLETTKKLCRNGYKVIATDIEEPEFSHSNMEFYEMDVTDKQSVKNAHNHMDNLHDLFCVINNAGVGILGPVEDTSVTDMEKIYDVNVFGVKRVTDQFLPYLLKNEGRLINISSLQSRFGTPGYGVYSSSKHAVRGLSKSMRNELSSANVDVVEIEPGTVKTDFHSTRKEVQPSRGELRKLIPYDNSSSYYSVEPQEVANVIYSAVNSESPENVYRVGFDSKFVRVIELLPEKIQKTVYRIIGAKQNKN